MIGYPFPMLYPVNHRSSKEEKKAITTVFQQQQKNANIRLNKTFFAVFLCTRSLSLHSCYSSNLRSRVFIAHLTFESKFR